MPAGRAAARRSFRTLAVNERVFLRLMAGGLLDRGSISLREREIVIDRTCARCRSEYEWGVHVAFFAERVRLHAASRWPPPAGGEVSAARSRSASACSSGWWTPLHDEAQVDDALWAALRVRLRRRSS